MRFLDALTGDFREEPNHDWVTYAILSHTWDADGEQTYQDILRLQKSWLPTSGALSIFLWTITYLGHAFFSVPFLRALRPAPLCRERPPLQFPLPPFIRRVTDGVGKTHPGLCKELRQDCDGSPQTFVLPARYARVEEDQGGVRHCAGGRVPVHLD